VSGTASDLPPAIVPDPALRDALNSWKRIVEAAVEKFEANGRELRSEVQDLRTQVQLQERICSDALKASQETMGYCRRIADESLHWVQQQAIQSSVPDIIPPMRSRAMSVTDWKGALEEVVEAASMKTKSIPSDRVREVLKKVMGEEQLATFKEEKSDKQKSARALRQTIVAGVVSLVVGLILAFTAGHFEGRAGAPQPAASAR
jgi:hypothetical protein